MCACQVDSTGHVPSEISLLTELTSVNVQRGKVQQIPSQVLELKNLKNLDLDKNEIDGLFPVGNSTSMDKLLRLDINFNSFTGSLDFLSQFPNLEEAHLDNNAFNGTIPEGIGELSSLRKSNISLSLKMCAFVIQQQTHIILTS